MKWECKYVSLSLLRQKLESITWVAIVNGDENWNGFLCFVKLMPYMKFSSITFPVIVSRQQLWWCSILLWFCWFSLLSWAWTFIVEKTGDWTYFAVLQGESEQYLCPFCGHQSLHPFLVRSGSSSLKWCQPVIVMILLLVTGLSLLPFYLPEGKSWNTCLTLFPHTSSPPPHFSLHSYVCSFWLSENNFLKADERSTI